MVIECAYLAVDVDMSLIVRGATDITAFISCLGISPCIQVAMANECGNVLMLRGEQRGGMNEDRITFEMLEQGRRVSRTRAHGGMPASFATASLYGLIDGYPDLSQDAIHQVRDWFASEGSCHSLKASMSRDLAAETGRWSRAANSAKNM